MAEVVYLLCMITSLACALLLARRYQRYQRYHTRLLLWSSLCFFGLMLENMALFVDLVLVPEVDLSLARNLVGLTAVVLLLIGLIWEAY